MLIRKRDVIMILVITLVLCLVLVGVVVVYANEPKNIVEVNGQRVVFDKRQYSNCISTSL